MLFKRLAVSNTKLSIVGTTNGTVAASSTPSYSLTSLYTAGGLGTQPAAGDLVVAAIGFKDGTNRNITCTTTGYTELTDLFQTATNSCQLAVYYKKLTTAETSVAFNIGVATDSFFVAQVWRNASSTQPDATTTTAQGTNQNPNAPAITTATKGAVVIAIGAGAASATNPFGGAAPSGGYTGDTSYAELSYSTNIFGIIMNSTYAGAIGSEDPPAFTNFAVSTNNGVCAATVAIRPGSSNI